MCRPKLVKEGNREKRGRREEDDPVQRRLSTAATQPSPGVSSRQWRPIEEDNRFNSYAVPAIPRSLTPSLNLLRLVVIS